MDESLFKKSEAKNMKVQRFFILKNFRFLDSRRAFKQASPAGPGERAWLASPGGRD
jgi:hypothetical protein